MDKIDFLHAIDYGNKQLTDMIINHLDQCMVLYGLVGSKDRVKRLEDTNNNVSFQIDMENLKSVENFVQKVNTTPNVTKYYGQSVNMQTRVVSDKSVIISMTKYTSRAE